jgi:hypothetical protein
MRKTAIVVALFLASMPAFAMDMPMVVQSSALKWGPPPPGLPPGAEVAIVSGDPGKEVPFVIRARMPAGYKVLPHTHPTAEHVTVLSGTAHIAMGDKFDPNKGEAVKPGGFFAAEKDMHHYFWTTAPTVIQVHGIGPFGITYINPADDPRNNTAAAAPASKK